MPAGQNELEFTGARLAEQSDGRAAEAFLAAIMFDLLNHSRGIFGAVKADEDFADHRLLIFGEELGNLFVSDHPVVVHLRTQRIVERETNRLSLLLLEALE